MRCRRPGGRSRSRLLPSGLSSPPLHFPLLRRMIKIIRRTKAPETVGTAFLESLQGHGAETQFSLSDQRREICGLVTLRVKQVRAGPRKADTNRFRLRKIEDGRAPG